MGKRSRKRRRQSAPAPLPSAPAVEPGSPAVADPLPAAEPAAEPAPAAAATPAKRARPASLSPWATMRFLQPYERGTPVEMPVEPMRDDVLAGFAERARSARDSPLPSWSSTSSSGSDDSDSSDSDSDRPQWRVGPNPYGGDEEDDEDDEDDEEDDGGYASAPEPGDRGADAAARKRPGPGGSVGRYWTVDVSTRCYNCGKVGHMARDCLAADSKPCYLCAQLGHTHAECPNTRCYRCLGAGHRSRDCDSRSQQPVRVCYFCASAEHAAADCEWAGDHAGDVGNARCLACGEEGHVNCRPPAPAPETAGVYCFNCGSRAHNGYECPEARMEALLRRMGGAGDEDRKCFVCSGDHLARDCPRVEFSNGGGGGGGGGGGHGGRGGHRARYNKRPRS